MRIKLGMRSYSQDIRERVIIAREGGEASRDVASRLRVSVAYVDRVWRRYRQEGERRARTQGGKRRAALSGHEATVRAWIEQEPGLTIEELRARCAGELSVHLSVGGMWLALKRMGLRYKKNPARKRTGAPGGGP